MACYVVVRATPARPIARNVIDIVIVIDTHFGTLVHGGRHVVQRHAAHQGAPAHRQGGRLARRRGSPRGQRAPEVARLGQVSRRGA